MNKVSIAVFNVVMLNIVNFVGYEASKMASISQNYTVPLITSTTQASVIDGTNYTTVLNVIFFMLTGLGAIGLILQAVPMFFYKFDEKGQEAKLKKFRERKRIPGRAEQCYAGINYKNNGG